MNGVAIILHLSQEGFPLCASERQIGKPFEIWITRHIQHVKAITPPEGRMAINQCESQVCSVDRTVNRETLLEALQGESGGTRCCAPLWVLQDLPSDYAHLSYQSLSHGQHIPREELFSRPITTDDDFLQAVRNWNSAVGAEIPEKPELLISAVAGTPQDSAEESDKTQHSLSPVPRQRPQSPKRHAKRRKVVIANTEREQAIRYLREHFDVDEKEIRYFFAESTSNTWRVAKAAAQRFSSWEDFTRCIGVARQERLGGPWKRGTSKRKQCITPIDIREAIESKGQATARSESPKAEELRIGNTASQDQLIIVSDEEPGPYNSVLIPILSRNMQHKESLERLIEGQLNDEVINASLDLIEQAMGRSKVRLVLSYVMTEGTPNLSRYQDVGSAAILLPLHLEKAEHWAIAIIEGNRSRALIYDSIPGTYLGLFRGMVERFCRLMNFGAVDIKPTSPLLQDKDDSLNCGVYALINALRHLLPQHSTSLGHADTRLWRCIFHRLLTTQPSPEAPKLVELSCKVPDNAALRSLSSKSVWHEADLAIWQACTMEVSRTVHQQANGAVQDLQEAEGILTCLGDTCASATIKQRLTDVRDEVKIELHEWAQRRAKPKNGL